MCVDYFADGANEKAFRTGVGSQGSLPWTSRKIHQPPLHHGLSTSSLLRVGPLSLLLLRKSFHTDLLILASEQAVEYTSFVIDAFPNA